MSMLLDESLARYRALSVRCGLAGPHHTADRPAAAAAVNHLLSLIAPLRLPQDLEALWRVWEPASFEGFARAGAAVLSPDKVAARWPLAVAPNPASGDGSSGNAVGADSPWPRILLPFVTEHNLTWTIELASDDHPGSRVLVIDGQGRTRVLAVGVSHVIELACEAMELSLAAEISVEDPDFAWLPTDQRRNVLATEINQDDADVAQSANWPAHWLAAQRFGSSGQPEPQPGPTHSVKDFDDARRWWTELRGTLRGTFTPTINGGAVDGTVGFLRDETGSIQVFIPGTTDVDVAYEGEIEVDVVACEPTDEPSDRGEIEVTGFVEDNSDYTTFFQDLFDAMANVDLSVVVTAVRPVAR
jgi:hypothetical protein